MKIIEWIINLFNISIKKEIEELKPIKIKNMEIVINRVAKKDYYTIGKLYIDGVYFCDTLEDVDRGLKQTDTLSKIKSVKIKDNTAIPVGRYEITLKVQSPKYKDRAAYAFCKGYLPRLLNVPGYDGILMHIGNFNTDTSGCLLLGENKVVGQVINSTITFNKFYPILKNASDNGEKIFITIS